MKLFKKHSVLFLVLLFIVQSCTDVVPIEVPNGGNRLVVEASIIWEKGTLGNEQRIKLSTSTPYFSKNKTVPVTGAKVVITKDNDTQDIEFFDQKNGNYITNSFIPELNASYTLTITYNGNTYVAKETLIPVSEITKVEQTKDKGISKDYTDIVIYFNDPADEDNYYLRVFTSSNALFPDYFAISDRFSNGQEDIDFWYEEEEFKPGDIVTASLLGISERYYYYINLLIGQQGGAGPFQTIPAQLVGNCKNINNPNEEVFGYFSLSEVTTVVKEIE